MIVLAQVRAPEDQSFWLKPCAANLLAQTFLLKHFSSNLLAQTFRLIPLAQTFWLKPVAQTFWLKPFSSSLLTQTAPQSASMSSALLSLSYMSSLSRSPSTWPHLCRRHSRYGSSQRLVADVQGHNFHGGVSKALYHRGLMLPPCDLAALAQTLSA